MKKKNYRNISPRNADAFLELTHLHPQIGKVLVFANGYANSHKRHYYTSSVFRCFSYRAASFSFKESIYEQSDKRDIINKHDRAKFSVRFLGHFLITLMTFS